jgi:hypothetical protein
MPGLPHYLNSKASTKRYEPFYQNLFEVTILPPATVSGGSILLEHVNKISGLAQDRGSDKITQKYKFAERSYASGVPTGTTTEPSIEFSLNLNDANELYVYKTIRNWWRLVFNPLTGQQGLKKDYVGSIIVTNYNRKGDIFWQRTFHECTPQGDLPELTADYSAGESVTMEVKWISDWWEENIV